MPLPQVKDVEARGQMMQEIKVKKHDVETNLGCYSVFFLDKEKSIRSMQLLVMSGDKKKLLVMSIYLEIWKELKKGVREDSCFYSYYARNMRQPQRRATCGAVNV